MKLIWRRGRKSEIILLSNPFTFERAPVSYNLWPRVQPRSHAVHALFTYNEPNISHRVPVKRSFKYVELFLSDDARSPASFPQHYRGLYYIAEKIKRDENRVNIRANRFALPDDITGGYILRVKCLPLL